MRVEKPFWEHTMFYNKNNSNNKIRFGIKNKVLKWFRSYIQNRTQTVMIDGVKSISQDLDWVVPPGSVLGPILDLLYTSPVGDISRRFELDFRRRRFSTSTIRNYT